MNFIEPTASLCKTSERIFHSFNHSDVIHSLLEQEHRFVESHLGGKDRVALFDLDNTLIVGDIGDAVFAQLLLEGFPFPLTWKEYRRLCRENPAAAYVECVRAMEGVKMEYIIQVSKRVLLSDKMFLVYEGEPVRLPKVNSVMQEIISLLRDWHYSIFIVSASNDISAKIAGSVLFDIPINNIAGIKPKLFENKLTRNLHDPIPVGIGKVAQYRLMSGDRRPMIVATDSELDIPLFQLCNPDGIAILVGGNQALYVAAKKELPLTVQIHRIPSHTLSSFQQQRCVA